MFSRLSALGCSDANMETALCTTATVKEFKNRLVNFYPAKGGQISAAVPDPDASTANVVTMMTYNIHRKQYVKQARTIAACNPDVVALQEVNDFPVTSHFNTLSKEIGYNGYWLSNLEPPKSDFAQYGIGLLWKPSLGNPTINYTTISPDKNPDDKENRSYLIAEFSNFCFIATHYSLNAAERLKMTEDIVKNSIVQKCIAAGKPVYIAGDFNETPNYDPKEKNKSMIFFASKEFEVLNNYNDAAHSTRQSGSHIDLIIEYNKNPNHKTLDSGVPVFPNSDWRFKISDHLPYFAKVQLK